jgi:hypothetical protein
VSGWERHCPPMNRSAFVSVLSTCVTKRTRDMVYSEARRLWLLNFGHTRRCCMPWKEIRIMDQRLQFLSSYQKEEMSVADLRRAYGISRPTAYRWINRYNETGPEGLVDRSSRPNSCSHATLEPIENTILVLRAKHPFWGASTPMTNLNSGARKSAAESISLLRIASFHNRSAFSTSTATASSNFALSAIVTGSESEMGP